jgi:hypothetical protein
MSADDSGELRFSAFPALTKEEKRLPLWKTDSHATIEEFKKVLVVCLPEECTIGVLRRYLSDPDHKELKEKLKAVFW